MEELLILEKVTLTLQGKKGDVAQIRDGLLSYLTLHVGNIDFETTPDETKLILWPTWAAHD